MSLFPAIDQQLAAILAAVRDLQSQSEDAYIHLNRRLTHMDARLEKLTADFAVFAAKVDTYVTAAEAFKATVAQQVAAAVAADDADEDVDITALGDAIKAASDKMPAAPDVPATPSP